MTLVKIRMTLERVRSATFGDRNLVSRCAARKLERRGALAGLAEQIGRDTLIPRYFGKRHSQTRLSLFMESAA